MWKKSIKGSEMQSWRLLQEVYVMDFLKNLKVISFTWRTWSFPRNQITSTWKTSFTVFLKLKDSNILTPSLIGQSLEIFQQTSIGELTEFSNYIHWQGLKSLWQFESLQNTVYLAIFLPLWFYVKSILVDFRRSKTHSVEKYIKTLSRFLA